MQMAPLKQGEDMHAPISQLYAGTRRTFESTEASKGVNRQTDIRTSAGKICALKSNATELLTVTRSARGDGTNDTNELDASVPDAGHVGHVNVSADDTKMDAPSVICSTFEPGTETTFQFDDTIIATLQTDGPTKKKSLSRGVNSEKTNRYAHYLLITTAPVVAKAVVREDTLSCNAPITAGDMPSPDGPANNNAPTASGGGDATLKDRYDPLSSWSEPMPDAYTPTVEFREITTAFMSKTNKYNVRLVLQTKRT